MRKWTACIAMAALGVAVFYAPLLHLHAFADGESPFIHAHLEEPEHHEAELVVHMEAEHADGEARAVDLFAATAVHSFQLDAVISAFESGLSRPEARWGFVSVNAPRAHAPPGASCRIPRSPPADSSSLV